MQFLSINQNTVHFHFIFAVLAFVLQPVGNIYYQFSSFLLGQVMIDKNPGITSAVNKINNIDNTYRNFQMEVLSGEENMMTKV